MADEEQQAPPERTEIDWPDDLDEHEGEPTIDTEGMGDTEAPTESEGGEQ